MDSTGAAQPPPDDQSDATRRESESDDTPQRDGQTPQSALLSPGRLNNPGDGFAYVLIHFGTWIEVNAAEGRQYTALGYTVLNRGTLTEVDWLNPLPAPTGATFEQQNTEVDAADTAMYEEANERYATPKTSPSGKKATPKKQTPPKDETRKKSPDGDGRDPPSGGAGAGVTA
ncbi:hypothetical protein EJ04DRAFT_569003 [Polyplosphaeria fusca]|uniref:Uncharacterized protein n=1 Tax=Polyplosphaeria fusca TaxID=682080 RepID=A0A9P4QM45_9PLEO|nr:hypothetical protein EJ04DRAFT_569003 [Polyplosphaeria fusca]